MKLIDDKPRLRRILIALINKAREENGHPTSLTDTRKGYENHHNQARSVYGADHHENLTRFTHKQHVFAHHISAYLWYGELMHTWLSMSSNGTLPLRRISEIRVYAAERGAEYRAKYGNQRKSKERKLPKSGFWGVFMQKQETAKRYWVAPEVSGIPYRVGSYADAKQAAIDYDIAALQLFGEGVQRNFPELSLMELRRLNLALRVPEPVIVKPEPVKKDRSWTEERKAAARKRFADPEVKKRMSEARKGKPNPNKGKPRSAEVRAKISAGLRKNPDIGKWNIGVKRTEEQKERQRQLAREKPNAYVKVTCPHCDYVCRQRREETRHFDNCRVLRNANKPDKAPCPHCGKLFGIYYLVNHAENCKHLRDLERSDKTPCPYCGLLYGVYLKTHMEKCKHKPAD